MDKLTEEEILEALLDKAITFKEAKFLYDDFDSFEDEDEDVGEPDTPIKNKYHAEALLGLLESEYIIDVSDTSQLFNGLVKRLHSESTAKKFFDALLPYIPDYMMRRSK